jgi:hypothetical protein
LVCRRSLYIPLDDNTFAFGQVLASHGDGSPTCLLFEGREDTPLSVDAIVELGFITILHTDGTLLESGHWKVVGHADPAVSATTGPWGAGGTSTGDGKLVALANAWFGLQPWNVMHQEDYFDDLQDDTKPVFPDNPYNEELLAISLDYLRLLGENRIAVVK